VVFRDLLERPLSGDIDTDLCIIGAGAAGITIARRFAGTGVRVCLIESGGMRGDEEVQKLYRGENVGMYYGLEVSRLRFFGGTTNHWSGVCGLQDPLDFEPRPWIGSLGWPIPREEMLPFYERAHEVLELGPFEYDPASAALGLDLPAFDPEKLELGIFRFSPPTRFRGKYGPELEAASNVECLLNANVVDFETTKDGSHVSAVRIATLGGGDWHVRAKVFVLACGGLENPRLLLNASVTPQGLGNGSGLVGCYFADHIHHPEMGLVVARGDWWEEFRAIEREGSRLCPIIRLGEVAQRREGLLNCRLAMSPIDPVPGIREDATSLTIYGHCEQMLRAENRVRLSDKRDGLGLRRISLDWSISEFERRTLRRNLALLAEELGRLELGSVRFHERLDAAAPLSKSFTRGAHHMCSTRMSEDPASGVVDADCRMHEVDNLYVGGSSVFPCSGQMNPTLTLVALALRLSDHLEERLGAAG
jgi:choline dehydrogenase-like flavoprotein